MISNYTDKISDVEPKKSQVEIRNGCKSGGIFRGCKRNSLGADALA